MSKLTSRLLDGINLLDGDIDSPSVFGKEHLSVSNFGTKPKHVVKSTTTDIVGGGYARRALIDDPLSSTRVSSRQLPPPNANRQLPINYLYDLDGVRVHVSSRTICQMTWTCLTMIGIQNTYTNFY